MSKNLQQRGLGKGLSALMGDDISILQKNKNQPSRSNISLSLIEPNVNQPRKIFSQESLKELSNSISKSGLIQPIIVRKDPNISDKYQIIAGERRWRASKMAGLNQIPAIIFDSDDKETLEISIIENIQRQDLNVVEEADGYKRLIEEFSYTQEILADKLGKSRSHVSNLLRLLTLPSEIKDKLTSGELSMGHARALVGVSGNIAIAEKLVNEKLSVRDTEKLIKSLINKDKKSILDKSKISNIKDTDEDLALIEKHISQKLGMQVNIEDDKNGGKITILFHNLEQLDKVLKKLSGEF